MTEFEIIHDILVEEERWRDALPDHESIILMTTDCVIKATALFAQDRDIEISISLTNDAGIHILNRDYRDKDKPTNVLSFPQIDWSDPDADLQAPIIMLGDIVIALETIERESAEQGKRMQDHFTHMLVHSILHLCGFDHEENADAEEMESLEIDILGAMGIENPYKDDYRST